VIVSVDIGTSIVNANPPSHHVRAVSPMCHTVHQEDKMSDIVEIARYSSEFAGQTALAHLQSEGITAQMVTDDAGGAFPSLTMLTGGVRVVVRAEDAEAATRALEVLGTD